MTTSWPYIKHEKIKRTCNTLIYNGSVHCILLAEAKVDEKSANKLSPNVDIFSEEL